MRHYSILLAVVIALSVNSLVRGDLTVGFDQQMVNVGVGDTFSLNIIATINEPIVGWGLDLTFDESILSLVEPPTIDPTWFAAFAADGDGLAGLAFPDSIMGTDVVLATISFFVDDVGQSELGLGFTLGDLTEGFALDSSGFATVTTVPVTVNVVPIPGALFLGIFGLGLTVFAKRRLS